jgi:hypothetical protein
MSGSVARAHSHPSTRTQAAADPGRARTRTPALRTGPAVFALQRTAGNRALVAAIQRKACVTGKFTKRPEKRLKPGWALVQPEPGGDVLNKFGAEFGLEAEFQAVKEGGSFWDCLPSCGSSAERKNEPARGASAAGGKDAGCGRGEYRQFIRGAALVDGKALDPGEAKATATFGKEYREDQGRIRVGHREEQGEVKGPEGGRPDRYTRTKGGEIDKDGCFFSTYDYPGVKMDPDRKDGHVEIDFQFVGQLIDTCVADASRDRPHAKVLDQAEWTVKGRGLLQPPEKDEDAEEGYETVHRGEEIEAEGPEDKSGDEEDDV